MKLRISATENADGIKVFAESDGDPMFICEALATALGELAVKHDYQFDEFLQDIWRVHYLQNRKC